MKVLVCGGRDFTDKEMLDKWLSFINTKEGPITDLIHGNARGADTLAKQWASDNGIAISTFPADWKTHGRKAGFIRNQQMLNEGKPDLVICFPGGKGASMMEKLSKLRNIDTMVILSKESYVR